MAWNSKDGYLPRECTTLDKTKIYELQKFCQCSECRTRQTMKRTPSNSATVYIKDLKNNQLAQDFLNNWTCENGSQMLPTVYKYLD